MSSYPTPPPTTSPKQYNSLTQPHDMRPQYPISHSTGEIPKIPAQESYFHSISEPSSPIQHSAQYGIPPYQPQSQSPYPPPPSSYQTAQSFAPQQPYQPQQSFPPSPAAQSQAPYTTGTAIPPRSSKRRTPPLTTQSPRPYSPSRSPRPLYSSPVNPLPTPYNASRPSPRPGLIKRIILKIQAGLRAFARWVKRNPVITGVLSFLPVMAVAGVVKVAKGVKHFGEGLGLVDRGEQLGSEGSTRAGIKVGENLAEGKKSAEKLWGWGLDNFSGFAGAQKDGGPLDGIARIVQMLMNHYCKLTPSAYPRVASILLELYFLDTRH